MPYQWDGIIDGGLVPTPIWLSRKDDSDAWRPLRKVDCAALNKANPGDLVHIEGGRATADPVNKVIRFNFYNSPKRELMPATWFIKTGSGGGGGGGGNGDGGIDHKAHHSVPASALSHLQPLSENDASLVEKLYQKARNAESLQHWEEVLTQDIPLDDDKGSRVLVMKNANDVLIFKKKPVGWFGNNYDLQRGYGNYSVEGEAEEVLLGPVRHLVFVVHGIGEAMWNRDDIGVLTLKDEIDRTRLAIQRKQVEFWKRLCVKARKDGKPLPKVPNRIEFLPIEWWDRVHSSSSDLTRALKSTTLPTIPGLRSIANDVVFDVLMYLTPDFCETVLECVTGQIDALYHGFQQVHPNFVRDGGKFSLIGHSLGSVICWDLLAVLKEHTEKTEREGSKDKLNGNSSIGYRAYAVTKDGQKLTRNQGSWGPSLPVPMEKCLPFTPEFTLFLGSPIGMFLPLRGANVIFEEMLDTEVKAARSKINELEEKMNASNSTTENNSEEFEVVSTLDALFEPITSPFSLPSGSIYNIFHPSDPVAYRIEPLLMAKDAQVPQPQYLAGKEGNLRPHIKAKQMGEDLIRTLQKKRSSIRNLWSSVAEHATSALEKIGPNQKNLTGDEDASQTSNMVSATLKLGPTEFALGGNSISRRVDFQLQTGVIDNEYFSAVSAHSNYFTNQDIQEFLIGLADTDNTLSDGGLLVDFAGQEKVE
eukprot:CAMPEP_0202460634 /NCGR_PEP_ID=MMETSP1360-20130828/45091_1 /ASSEMBLY_ACC=CAM_ASM_000848 /TAXON_ID=515479 /ORGANISM="Licmophora paradoxa, Strain CCMP2313" /LENGTH=702 /DNA_ID=CAMNT_0049082377 /DNA_START=19 /DNA_END=2127 /DNA_ORIENTATION=+